MAKKPTKPKRTKPRSRRTEPLYPQTFLALDPLGHPLGRGHGNLTWNGWAKDDDPIYTQSGWNFLSGKNLAPPKRKGRETK